MSIAMACLTYAGLSVLGALFALALLRGGK